MALTKAQLREILSKAGVNDENMSDAVNEIISGHTASIEALREKVTTLEQSVKDREAETEKLSGVQKEYEALKKQVADDAKAREGKDYDKLKEEYDAYKAERERQDARAKKEAAFRAVLKEAEIDRKYYDKICKYSDIDSIELDDDGKVKDAAERVKAVRKEWPEYSVTTRERGADTPDPPMNNGGSGMTREEIENIADTDARQKAIAENHELFGF